MPEKETGLTFEERGIANALAQRLLRVPLNQRSYAWTDDQVQMLLDDLYRAFLSDDTIYFLGTIVLTRGLGNNWEIADGQQRLATVTVLIAAVRDFLLELDDKAGAQKYQEKFLLDYDVRKKTSSPKLHLNFEDHDFFQTQILEKPADRTPFLGQTFASHERLGRAAKLAGSHVRSIAAAVPPLEKADRLYDWVDFLSEAAKVILIMVPGSVGNAFKMFETLNARGAEASKTDILKNYLFDLAKARLGEAHPRWIAMLSAVESIGEDDLLIKFLRHFWISLNGPTTERELGSSIEAKIRSERQSLDFLSSLAANAEIYVAMLSPRDDPRLSAFSREARNAIHVIINDLGGEQIRPLILSVVKNFEVFEAEKTFAMMVSWSVRFLIAGGGGGGVLDRSYGMRAKEISSGDLKTAKALRGRMADVVPSDVAFSRAFAGASVRKAALARYYLRAIEAHMAADPEPEWVPNEDTGVVNLEQVLPVTPSKQWNINEEIAEAYYRRIGNMVLLKAKINVEIGNAGFEAKRQALSNSDFLLTKQVGLLSKWGPEEIDRRQLELAEKVSKVWPL